MSLRSNVRTHRIIALGLIMVLLLSLGSSAYAARPAASAGPNEITINEFNDGQTVDLNGEVLVVHLKSQPSTGYGWQVQALDASVLSQVDATEWLPDTARTLGGWGTQVLRFSGIGKGMSNLKLVYARSWETGVPPTKTFSLAVRVVEATTGVIHPQVSAGQPESATDEVTPSALPAAYNWCDLGGCTPVRNQGQCGSCWAFGTVGPLESAILLKDGVSRDLAEQYLVSCNTDGWGCDGGWWAHDYHEWKYPAGEPGPGAVYESDFPYTATDVPCNPPHTHHEKIASWAFVGSESGVPTTAAIKQAIVDHGPVAAAVCVDSAFQNYKSGVFGGSPLCFSLNHAIVLVGWDDSVGAWILRNSWGPYWGESGYMRIAYGASFVGYSANYVVYESSTPPTPPAAPAGLTATAISSSQINLSWTDNANNEDGFKIERCTGAGCSSFAQIATVSANVTTYSNTGLSASTSYSYRVRAYNTGFDSDYSNTATAETAAPPALPAAPSNLVATPVSRTQINLTWTDNATNESGFYIERCKGATCTNFAQIATVGANVISYANTKLVGSTTYRYRIRAYNAAGTSAYSNIAAAKTPKR